MRWKRCVIRQMKIRSSSCSALEKLSVREGAKEVSNCLLQADPAVPE